MLNNIVLDEEVNPNYEPTEKEVLEYADWLGMDLQEDADLLWIAKEGLKAPLPKAWKPCQVGEGGEIFYFNYETGESVWDHPCDEHYRKKLKRAKLKSNLVVGSLHTSTSDAQSVLISVMSMGGEELFTSELKSRTETLHDLQRRLKKQTGQQMQLLLPNGRLLGKHDKNSCLCELLEVEVLERVTPSAELEAPGDSTVVAVAHFVNGVLPPLKRTKRPCMLKPSVPEQCMRFGTILPFVERSSCLSIK